MKSITVLLAFASLALLRMSMAAAGPITFVFDGTATGTLGAQTFSDADLSVTALGDTANIPAPDSVGVIRFNTPVTIKVAGLGSTTIASGGQVGCVPADQFVYFGVGPSDIQVFDSSFATYLFKTAIGPVFEATDPSTVDWMNMSTPQGNLTVSSYTDLTFTATVSGGGDGGGGNAVPLPSAAWLSLIGLPLATIAARRGIKSAH
jgi:hypothetical protein